MLASLKTILQDAQKRKYAVGAFNVLNLEYAIGLIQAAQIENSPIILQISPSIIQLFGLSPILRPCIALAEKATVPVCVHLDHGKDRQTIIDSIYAGFSSVMFDGSSLSFRENVDETVFLVQVAHDRNVSIEAEIGKVGKEEDGQNEETNTLQLTDLNEVIQFAQLTKVDALAVSIGSVHGVKSPHITLEIKLLEQIKKFVSIPLVLHGSSGVTDESIVSAIKAGITKINVATRLKVKVASAFYHIAQELGEHGFTDSRLISTAIIDAVKAEAVDRIQLFNSLRSE